jgi:phosphoribosylaminoimidazolecarboxamide formyltransferase / IMP cyclohydrolase
VYYSDPKYSTITDEHFTPVIEISFIDGDKRQTLTYEKVIWETGKNLRSLRYGDNPDQPAALYKLTNGNLILGEVEQILPGRVLASDPQLLQPGKHPGKINMTDADRSLALLRTLMDEPTAVIVKHGNPSGVAHALGLEEAVTKAIDCDRVASYGGCIGLNRAVDRSCAEAIATSDLDMIVAPDYEHGVIEVFEKRPTMRVLKIANIERLAKYTISPVVDFTSLIDGGLIVQWSRGPESLTEELLAPATCVREGKSYRSKRTIKGADASEMVFAWKVACSMSSNAVVFVKGGATVGIGTGQQDSLTAVEVARDKAYRKTADRIALGRFSKLYNGVKDPVITESIMNDVQELRGGLMGSIMASDSFFPSAGCVNVAFQENVSGIIQPGGGNADHDVIEACNEAGVPMVFTGYRSFVD